MMKRQFDIPCVWNGILSGILLKNEEYKDPTTKMICIHGWLDNLNSMLPLAEKLIQNQPHYEIYLYDRAGHGFSSHIPKGFDYSGIHFMQELRGIIRALSWSKEKFSIIGHSYGAIIGMMYAASYPDEVLCLVTIDALPRHDVPLERFFPIQASRIDASIQYHTRSTKNSDIDLEYETAFQLIKESRGGITDQAAALLTERSIRRNSDNKLIFTRDPSLNLLSIYPFPNDLAQYALETIKASVLFIGSKNPQWPRSQYSIDLLQKHNPHFEMMLIDAPHHLHMTHIDEVTNRIEQYFAKYLRTPVAITNEAS